MQKLIAFQIEEDQNRSKLESLRKMSTTDGSPSKPMNLKTLKLQDKGL